MIILSLGTNLEPKLDYLRKALIKLEDNGVEILKRSKVYTTPPWGGVATEQFLNMCVVVSFNKGAYELLNITQKIELELGRIRKEHWGNRTIDIDIITFNNKEFNDSRLTVPHKYIHERNFVLLPIYEMVGDMTISGRSVKNSLDKIVDKIEVYRDNL